MKKKMTRETFVEQMSELGFSEILANKKAINAVYKFVRQHKGVMEQVGLLMSKVKKVDKLKDTHTRTLARYWDLLADGNRKIIDSGEKQKLEFDSFRIHLLQTLKVTAALRRIQEFTSLAYRRTIQKWARRLVLCMGFLGLPMLANWTGPVWGNLLIKIGCAGWLVTWLYALIMLLVAHKKMKKRIHEAGKRIKHVRSLQNEFDNRAKQLINEYDGEYCGL